MLINIVVFYPNGTGSGTEVPGEHSQKGSFARPIGPEQPHNLSPRDIERDLIYRTELIEVLREVFDMDHGLILSVPNSIRSAEGPVIKNMPSAQECIGKWFSRVKIVSTGKGRLAVLERLFGMIG
jgi:hypothetical protein